MKTLGNAVYSDLMMAESLYWIAEIFRRCQQPETLTTPLMEASQELKSLTETMPDYSDELARLAKQEIAKCHGLESIEPSQWLEIKNYQTVLAANAELLLSVLLRLKKTTVYQGVIAKICRTLPIIQEINLGIRIDSFLEPYQLGQDQE